MEKAHGTTSQGRWHCGWVFSGAKHDRSRDRREGSLCWITTKLKRKLKYKGSPSSFRVDKEGSCTSKTEQGSATGDAVQVISRPEDCSGYVFEEAKPAAEGVVVDLVALTGSWLHLEEVKVLDRFEIEAKDPAF